MLQVDTRRMIEAAEESIQHEAGEILEDDLYLTATEAVFGTVAGQLSPLTATTGETSFYATDTWNDFFEELQNTEAALDTAVDTVAMPELQVALEIQSSLRRRVCKLHKTVSDTRDES